jgi:hypothetical protein
MRHLWLILALLAGAGLARPSTLEPRPTPLDAQAASFSSARAMTDVRVIAARPHPVGSAENRQVRDHLTGRLRDLGLETRLQRDTGMVLREGGTLVLGADVENLIGVLPGRDRAAPALALMAHYDSAPRSPGAGDDAAGVAVALEVVRAITARGVPARDIVVLLTDGEEPGMLGVQAFFDRDPMAAHIGLVVNLEARGGAGRAIMFETSRDNGGLIAALRKSAVAPTANSLANVVYQNMPNGTDFSSAAEAGKAGFNFAFLGRQFDYHSPTATPANLHEGAVQSMGQEVLALVDDLAFAPALPARAPDVAYSQTFGPLIVAYPLWAGWIVLAAAVGLLAVAIVRARRRAAIGWADTAFGAAASLAVLVIAAGLLWLARLATGTPEGFVWQLPLLARFPLWETAMGLIGLAALIVAAALTARRDAASVWLGVLAPASVLAIALQAWMPSVAHLIAWPLALAGMGAAISVLSVDGRWPFRLVLSLVAALSLGWLGGMAHFVAIGLDAPWVLSAFVWLAGLSLWPLLHGLPGRLAWAGAATLLLASTAIIGVLRFTDSASPRHPEATAGYYVAEPQAGKFWLATPAPVLSAWSKALLGGGTGPIQRRPLIPLMREPFAAPASPVATPAYRVDLRQAADCTVTVNAPWLSDARALSLDLTLEQPATAATVAGRAADLLKTPGARTAFRWRRADAGLGITFRPSAPGKVAVRYALMLDHWPVDADPPPPRSSSQMAWGDSDALVLLGSAEIAAAGC